MKSKIIVISIIILLFIILTPISSTIGALNSLDDLQNIDNNLILRVQYFEKGQLQNSFESKNSIEEIKKLKKIIVDMQIAFKERDKLKIESCINYLKDNHFIDKSLSKSCLNILRKSINTNNNDIIEDKFCLVFVYSNNSLNAYFSEIIFGLIFTNLYFKLTEIGFSGEIFFKLFNEIFYSKILIHLVRLLFIKPIAPIILSMIYDGFVYSLGPNGFGAMNADDYDIGIGAFIGPFSGITIDILIPDKEYSKFLFIFGVSGIVHVDEIKTFP
ncbi:MAG: hypothetical protein JSU91_02065 [Thermoplasmatales archaeon]|nr:MAG: hypothetical protein JSU91_02065 [Thermoplasmatales archaeon]